MSELDPGPQLALPGLVGGLLAANVPFGQQPLGNRHHEPVDALLGLLQLLLGIPDLPAHARHQLAPLREVFLHEEVGVVGVEELRHDPVEDNLLDPVEPPAAIVVARHAFARPGAADRPVAVTEAVERHPRPAVPALQDAREEVVGARAMRLVLPLLGELLLALLDGLPDVHADDGQVGPLDRLPLLGRVRLRDAPTRVRVAEHGCFVPDDLSDVHLVLKDAEAALRVAVDRAGVPRPALARRLDAFGVEVASDVSRCLAEAVFLKDASDDFGLLLVDHAHARLAFHKRVAIGQPARAHAIADAALHSSAGLVGEVGEVERAQHAAHADLDLICLAVVDGLDVDPGKAEPLVHASKVFLIARQAVEGLNDHDLKLPRLRCVQEIENAFAVDDVGTGLCSVVKLCDDLDVDARGVRAAERDLVLNRPGGLQVRTVSGVDRRLPLFHSR